MSLLQAPSVTFAAAYLAKRKISDLFYDSSTSRVSHMVEARSQKRWREKYRFVKSQLNVMAQKQTHLALHNFAHDFELKGKGEAVAFACFVTRALIQRAQYDDTASQMLEDFLESYHRSRDMHAA